jgi:ribosome-binding protein aMBF1 (putative translation factor)
MAFRLTPENDFFCSDLIAKAIENNKTKKKRKRTIQAVIGVEYRDPGKSFNNTELRRQRGKMIAYLREQRGLSQTEFGRMINSNRTYVSHIENGKSDLTCKSFDYWLSKLGGKLIIVPF